MWKPKIERVFYRNGQLREAISFNGNQLHGPSRTWYSNGKLASEEFYEHGVSHGLCRQWNGQGKLLGSFRMRHGTGIRREWFQNGRLQSEISKVDGLFTGRLRTWLRDGTLAYESYAIKNRSVSRMKYLAAARQHPEYPRFPASRTRLRSEAQLDKREFELHVKWLLSRRNRCEARKWLEAGAQQRSVGLLNFTQAGQLVKNLYEAEAERVMAVTIYLGKTGKQFSDALLVKMPAAPSARRRIRQILATFPKKLRAAVLPEADDQTEYLFATFE